MLWDDIEELTWDELELYTWDYLGETFAYWIRKQVLDPQLRIIYNDENITEYVKDIGSISRKAEEIVMGGASINLINADKTWNKFLAIKSNLRKIGKIQLIPKSDFVGWRTLITGKGDDPNFREINVSLPLKDKMLDLAEKKVGDDKTSIKYYDDNNPTKRNPADLAWDVLTIYGGLDDTASSDNTDIDYSSWTDWKSVFAAADTKLELEGNFTGQSVLQILQLIAEYTGSVIFINAEGKVEFYKWVPSELPEIKHLFIPDNIKELSINLDSSKLTNDVKVFYNYDPANETWEDFISETSAPSQSVFGKAEKIINDTVIWHKDVGSAGKHAVRLIELYKSPIEIVTIKTFLMGVLVKLGDMVGVVSSLYGYCKKPFRILGLIIKRNEVELIGRDGTIEPVWHWTLIYPMCVLPDETTPPWILTGYAEQGIASIVEMCFLRIHNVANVYALSDEILKSDDTEKHITNADWVKYKSLTLPSILDNTTIRVKFDMKSTESQIGRSYWLSHDILDSKNGIVHIISSNWYKYKTITIPFDVLGTNTMRMKFDMRSVKYQTGRSYSLGDAVIDSDDTEEKNTNSNWYKYKTITIPFDVLGTNTMRMKFDMRSVKYWTYSKNNNRIGGAGANAGSDWAHLATYTIPDNFPGTQAIRIESQIKGPDSPLPVYSAEIKIYRNGGYADIHHIVSGGWGEYNWHDDSDGWKAGDQLQIWGKKTSAYDVEIAGWFCGTLAEITTTIYSRIYRNGSPVGLEYQRNNEDYHTFSQDISGWKASDKIELYTKVNDSQGGHIRNFRFCGTLTAEYETTTVYGRVYRNGSPVGAEKSRTNENWQSYSQDIAGWVAGDKIEWWEKCADAHGGYARNFRLCGILTPEYGTTTIHGLIARNESPVGVEKSRTNKTYGTYSQDIAGWKTGDKLQLYARCTDGYIRNHRIWGTLTPTDYACNYKRVDVLETNATGNAVEVRVKMTISGVPYTLSMEDGTKKWGIKIFTDKITKLDGSTVLHTIDTTNDYHTYRITAKLAVGKFYFDGPEKTGDDALGNSSENRVIFGCESDADEHKSYCDYIKYYTNGAKEPL